MLHVPDIGAWGFLQHDDACSKARLRAISSATAELRDIGGLCGPVQEECRAIWIYSFAVGEIDIADRNRCVFFILEWPEEWRKFYLTSGFVQRDPLVEMIPVLGKPFSWSELRNSRKLSHIGREALKMLADNGWTEGLAVPVPRGGTRYGLVSLVGHGEVPHPTAERIALPRQPLRARPRAESLPATAAASPRDRRVCRIVKSRASNWSHKAVRTPKSASVLA